MPTSRVIAAVALGSNRGDRHAHIAHAFSALAGIPSTSLLAQAPIIETLPVARPGTDPGGLYLNSAALLETELLPRELLAALHAAERASGRDRARESRWGPRTLDLDLLTYGDRILREPGLTIPHPRMTERRFVLEPLATIAPDLVVPNAGRVLDLLHALQSGEHP
jgi:2-amino-4-hydroxy-6-hydroxymethyldihydropteridine diphosphokinase